MATASKSRCRRNFDALFGEVAILPRRFRVYPAVA